MLNSLTIHNIVLIEDLHIDFQAGLCVLTGETGAGKSILLDALGLALGERAEGRLLRQGAFKAYVIAVFSLPSPHALWQDLEEQGIVCEDNQIIFRRLIEIDGKSKCFLNDHLISQTLMRRLGQKLVEVHGQFDQLLDAKSHLGLLDAYGKCDKEDLQAAFKAYRASLEEVKAFQDRLAQAYERQTFLSFAIEEIEKIAPREGEEKELESERTLIAHRAKIAETLLEVDQALVNSVSGLSLSYKTLSRIQDLLPEKIPSLIRAIDRALLESQDAFESMKVLKREVEETPRSLEFLENRLYTLRSLLRKYRTEDLVSLLEEFKTELLALEQGEDRLQALKDTVISTKNIYLEHASALSEFRKKAGARLQAAITQELPSLKLEHAKFRVHFENLPEQGWGESGIDRVEFYIRPNPGLPEGPLAAIASGGERSRLMLALKVAFVQSESVPTLIFDEIESGTGGAVTSAMGERLKNLSQHIQVLAITHSPQIASHGAQHFVVFKVLEEGNTKTYIKALDNEEREEEVARLLSGEEITEEARAAAQRLIGSSRWIQSK